MLIPKQNRKLIYQSLFNEGVLVVKKDFNAPRHADIEVPNLQVIKAMQSLKSRNYVTEQFNWQWHYFFLTDEGINYLRSFLNIPESVVPATIAKAGKALGRPTPIRGEERRNEQDGYRSREKKVGAGADFNPEFKGGYGRGRPAREQQA